MADMHTVKWSHQMVVGGGTALRARLGNWLRKLATKVDGRRSLAVSIVTEPQISEARVKACIIHGLRQIPPALESEAHDAAITEAMKHLHPELFGEEVSS